MKPATMTERECALREVLAYLIGCEAGGMDEFDYDAFHRFLTNMLSSEMDRSLREGS